MGSPGGRSRTASPAGGGGPGATHSEPSRTASPGGGGGEVPHWIDLHSHTIASDGELTPTALLQRAAASGVRTLAVTDHDTVQGLAEAAVAARAAGVELVNGIELSAELNGREIHVLGHFLEPTAPGLVALASEMGAERRERMERMVAKLAAQGFPVTMEAVLAEAKGAIGRPHLARVLVARGLAANVGDAFKKFLKPGMPGYVERRRLEAAQAISLLVKSGGTATVAHPGINKVSQQELRELASLGLAGVEANHPDHVPSQVEAYERWGRECGLVATAGSDFHGEKTTPGRKLGERSMRAEALAALRARAHGVTA